tara:strand:- start:299 stop:1006 length:708 start_codon:yes stop_codon:yes gene_type:complete
MADISKEIDKIAELIEAKTGQAIEEVATALYELVQNKTGEEALEILSGINMQYALDAKLAGVFATMDTGAILLLENIYTTVPLTEVTLRTLLEMAKKKLRTKLTEELTDTMMQSIIDGIATGSPIESVIESVGEATPSITTLVNTTYNQFSNTITNMMIEKLPDNTRMIYIGPYDDITRDYCIERIGYLNGKATKKDILGKFGNFNNALWNCRHKWEERGRKPDAQGFSPEKFED